MSASTPERQGRSARDFTSTNTFLLPPLSAMLSTALSSPPRPRLPVLNSFATPKALRNMLPSIWSAGTPSTVGLPAHRSTPNPLLLSATANILEAAALGSDKDISAAICAPASALKRPSLSLADTSMGLSDADTSGINDSMVKQSTRSKPNSTTLATRDFAFISHSLATYPSQEPSIDNASLARRKRRRTSPNELAVLNEQFCVDLTPDKTRRSEIAARVNMTEKAVQIWFQNKRQSLRRLKSADREVTELPPTPDSSAVLASPPSPNQPLSQHQTPATSSVPVYESTPIRPTLAKSESHHYMPSPALDLVQKLPRLAGPVQSPVLEKDACMKGTLFLKMLVSPQEDKPDKTGESPPQLVMNLTNKKQHEFAWPSAKGATQAKTFKLTLKERKSLTSISTNTTVTPAKAHHAKVSQCTQSSR